MFKHPYVRYILSALAVAVFGFALLNLNFFFSVLVAKFLGLFVSEAFVASHPWFPAVQHLLFVLIIALISWFVFRSKLGVLYKAIFLTVPLIAGYMTLGILLHRSVIVSYGAGVLFTMLVFWYLYRTRQPWLFYYTATLVALSLLLFNLLD